jgi:colanic acid biosynthesis protein WcaH
MAAATAQNRLSDPEFEDLIRLGPLIAMDLVVRNEHGQYLLGQRVNEPARGFWFVPGGRIYKNERMAQAFIRITTEELGVEFELNDSTRVAFLGPYEHLYQENFFKEPGLTTHYVVLGYSLAVGQAELALPDAQHHSYSWMMPADILDAPHAHENTKAYFR